jgi:hypothetical protein
MTESQTATVADGPIGAPGGMSVRVLTAIRMNTTVADRAGRTNQ